MKALALDFEARTLDWGELDPPEFYANRDVMYRVHEVGICGTDRALASFQLGAPPKDETRLISGAREALGQVVGTAHHAGVQALNRIRRLGCACHGAARLQILRVVLADAVAATFASAETIRNARHFQVCTVRSFTEMAQVDAEAGDSGTRAVETGRFRDKC